MGIADMLAMQERERQKKIEENRTNLELKKALGMDITDEATLEKQLTEGPIYTETMITIIPEDQMSAMIHIINPDNMNEYTVDEIMDMLRAKGIVQGINTTMVERIVQEKWYNKDLVVAQGRKAVDGKDGYFEFLFRTKLPSKPLVREDGSVDYREMDIFEKVEEGQRLANYHGATGGTMGYTVTGKLLLPKRGKEKPALRGKGFRISEDKKSYFSVYSGEVETKNGMLNVNHLYTCLDDLSPKVGNVHFDGDVHIVGSVLEGMAIEATGNVVVDGNVEAACIMAGGNILVKKGAYGKGKGFISAGGNVFGKFFESMIIQADCSVTCNYMMNCSVKSGERIVVSGRKGVLVGGDYKAIRSISAYNIGNASEVSTKVSVGIDKEYIDKYREYEKRIGKIQSEIKLFQENVNNPVLYEKIILALNMKKDELEVAQGEFTSFSERMDFAEKPCITALSAVYPGVTVNIDTVSLYMKETVDKVNFKHNGEKVSMYRN